jgi:hypothetical protein
VQLPPRPKKKARRGAVQFSIPEALRRADEILAGPCRGYLPRVPGRGNLLQRFVLPLELCKTTNALLSMMQSRPRKGSKFTPAAQSKALEERVFRMMFLQHPRIRVEPLAGRPMIRIVRFSSVESDEAADGMKLARDLLRMPKAPVWSPSRNRMVGGRKGFGFLVADAPRYVETARWWDYAPPGKGFSLLEIWSGEP